MLLLVDPDCADAKRAIDIMTGSALLARRSSQKDRCVSLCNAESAKSEQS
jgi:hypothetical protein